MGKTIVSAKLVENNGALSVTGTGKVTALSEGTDTVILTTADGKIYRMTVTVKGRKGTVALKSGRLRLRKTAGTGSVLTYLTNGASVTILEREGQYFKVRAVVNGKTYEGFVPRSYVKK